MPPPPSSADRTVALYPWFRFLTQLLFWQSVWFLFFQSRLTAAEAILLYAIYDVATTALEVPSGYLSDRAGRRLTLMLSCAMGAAAMVLLTVGSGFAVFAAAQVLLGGSIAFASGTDSALLYESLCDDDRADAVEAQELRAWRFAFTGLALSAAIGGVLAQVHDRLPFAASALAMLAALVLTRKMAEPRHRDDTPPQGGELLRLSGLGAALRQPVLRWLLGLSVAFYIFSHVPFVFGQPFILQALDGLGLAGEAPLVSGVVTAAMMTLSLAASSMAPVLRRILGLGGLLLFALALQVALCAILALTGSAPAIAALLLRMVPSALSGPFVLARIQPLLSSDSRATYLSLQSLAGHLCFAATLWLAARGAGDASVMAHDELRRVLGAYVIGGGLTIAVLGAILVMNRRHPDSAV
ncbi:MAG: MFS transporter [Paracoccaceae bacterium]